MLTEPQIVSISNIEYSMPAVSRGENESTYMSADGNAKLTIKHSYGARTRRLVRLDFKKIAADPITAVNKEISMSAYLVIDQPRVGFNVAEASNVVNASLAFLTASSGLNVTKVLGGES